MFKKYTVFYRETGKDCRGKELQDKTVYRREIYAPSYDKALAIIRNGYYRSVLISVVRYTEEDLNG